jgi:hypothetical protein
MQATRIIHAYKQAPWRIQRQWAGAFLLAVIGIAMVAALFLDVTSRAAVAGREIQEMRFEILTTQRANADLETRLAKLTSSAEMESRARALGYRPVQPGELDYIAVPGFVAPEPELLRSAQNATLPESSLPYEYSESLIEWLDGQIKSGGRR